MNEDSFSFVILAFALAVGGGALGATLGTSHKRLCALISLGAGTLLGVTAFAILPETLDELKWWQLLLALGSGYAVFAVISKYIFHVCPACAASHFDEATTHRFSEIASAMMLALAIHCTVDGLAMAAGHASQDQTVAAAHPATTPAQAPAQSAQNPREQQSRITYFSIILAVCVHKVPEGLALGALLLGAGLTRNGILIRVIAVESTTLLGGAVGLLFLPSVSQFWLAVALAHAGGGFLFLATHAVIGEILKHHKALVLTSFGAGFGAIGLFTLLLRLL
ncbi:MAG: ZIP family metal transporter [Verrucomicrobiota bacterium]|jgi:zinc transporter ZupT